MVATTTADALWFGTVDRAELLCAGSLLELDDEGCELEDACELDDEGCELEDAELDELDDDALLELVDDADALELLKADRTPGSRLCEPFFVSFMGTVIDGKACAVVLFAACVKIGLARAIPATVVFGDELFSAMPTGVGAGVGPKVLAALLIADDAELISLCGSVMV